MNRATHAQMIAAKNVRDAIQSLPPGERVRSLTAFLPDFLTSAELEELSNLLGRAGHEKARTE